MAEQTPAKITTQAALEMVISDRLEPKGDYFKVPTALFVGPIDLNMPSLPPVAFYTDDDTPQVLREKDQAYSAMALSVHDFVLVHKDDIDVVKKNAESQVLDSSSSIPPEKRMETLRKSAMTTVEDLYNDPSPENIERSVKVVGSFVYVLMKDPKAYSILTELSSHDPYTLQHSVGTAVHCIILGRKVGITDEQRLNDLGVAGLLHDIGKVKIDRDIINKTGPLNETEWEEMRQHSQEGYEIVKSNPSISEEAKLAILEHHEDRNGTGYPDGKKLQEIGEFSRIVAICDIFNALTTDRTYSNARTPFEAFQFMREKLPHKVDEDHFKALVEIYGGSFGEA